ncbi:uncharacterized protein LOC114244225 [Bombyx mandarina]|uniref:Uncharacterized protein LOC114244225 n=1 Tax=Bombyx mandarina TaxID=7092 RepID=A0A6J2JR69_BOMMA|nr:uncharacterized protein LOC114244225 [Bombyx mandarina]
MNVTEAHGLICDKSGMSWPKGQDTSSTYIQRYNSTSIQMNQVSRTFTHAGFIRLSIRKVLQLLNV